MQTETPAASMHLGRKISRIRELRGMKQETLAAELGVSQQAVSKLEQSEHVDEEKLEMVAKALGVSAESIKNFDEEKAIYNIQNNYEGSNNQGANVGYQCNLNPLEKIVQLYDEKIALYERMLSDKNDMIENLKKLLSK